MGYCYFCEDEWVGYVSGGYYCVACLKLQQLCKAVGVEKITQSIKIKFDDKKEGVKTRSQTKETST